MSTITASRSLFVTLAATVALTGSLVAASSVTARAADGFHSVVVFGQAGVPVQV